jgi:hypothetical protein
MIAPMADTPVAAPRDGQGFRAEVAVGGELGLVLMTTHSGVGPVVSVHDAAGGCFFRDWAEDLEDGKRKALAAAQTWWKRVGVKKPFPEVVWKPTG